MQPTLDKYTQEGNAYYSTARFGTMASSILPTRARFWPLGFRQQWMRAGGNAVRRIQDVSSMLKIDIHKNVRGIASSTLDRPDVHNALNDELVSRDRDIHRDLGQRAEIRVIVLAGSGKSFCAGADLNWMKRVVHTLTRKTLKMPRWRTMYLAIAKCPKPVIARVHGAALGGGAG